VTQASGSEPGAAAPSRTTRPLAIGVGVLALVTAVLALILFTRDQQPTSAASPSPEPSASVPTTSSPTPSQSPSSPVPTASTTLAPTPTVSPGIALPDGLLPAGSVISVTSDGVRIREEPSTDAAIVTTMSAGELAYVVDDMRGPVEADGYEWYRIQYADGENVWPWMDVAPDGLVGGWVAAGNATARFVELSEVTCEAEPLTLEVLAFDMTPFERLVCISGTTVTIDAADFCRQEGFGGCGGTTPGAAPTWLADGTQHTPMVLPGNMYYPFVMVAIPPELVPAYDDLPLGRVLRISLHVDDPAAATCALTGEPDDTGRTADPDAVRVWCRERLVLESFEDVGANDLP
jgi:hypothetical protein